MSREGESQASAPVPLRSPRATREGRIIYLVDHRAHDFGGFAGTTVVRKTDKGTTIEPV